MRRERLPDGPTCWITGWRLVRMPRGWSRDLGENTRGRRALTPTSRLVVVRRSGGLRRDAEYQWVLDDESAAMPLARNDAPDNITQWSLLRRWMPPLVALGYGRVGTVCARAP